MPCVLLNSGVQCDGVRACACACACVGCVCLGRVGAGAQNVVSDESPGYMDVPTTYLNRGREARRSIDMSEEEGGSDYLCVVVPKNVNDAEGRRACHVHPRVAYVWRLSLPARLPARLPVRLPALLLYYGAAPQR